MKWAGAAILLWLLLDVVAGPLLVRLAARRRRSG